jgi:putative resolvase
VNERTVLVAPEAIGAEAPVALGLYARVSSYDQRADLDRQVARLSEWAARTGNPVVRVEVEVGSGMNGSRSKLRRLLADPRVTMVVVEHRDRLARMNAELVEAALSAHGRRLVVLDDGEVDDDLVRDMLEVLTSFCAQLYGRRTTGRRRRCAARSAAWDRRRYRHRLVGARRHERTQELPAEAVRNEPPGGSPARRWAVRQSSGR